MRLNERHGIRIHAEPAAQALGFLAVHHLEAQRETSPTALPATAGAGDAGVEDQDAPDAAPEQQLGEDQPRLDGLAEADVVGDEQADTRHAQRLEERNELVALHAHPAMERTRNRLPGRRAFAAGGGRGRGRGPSSGRRGGARRSPPPAWRRRHVREPAGRLVRGDDGSARSPTGCVLRTERDRPCTRGGRDGAAPSRRRRARRPRPLRAGCGRWRASRRGGTVTGDCVDNLRYPFVAGAAVAS